ncbi:hypothetical protein [Hyalangium minutum]|uniref:Uncharacterized protein n=1 Tax=Hyalangium minutum TaxID=394096 RepID=A0A085WKW6_9BACT|nr:hypothetical protein [Hyalangium minutum]KFE68329.1 hypothetical protein DB31_7566 [Hyalangium minutum]
MKRLFALCVVALWTSSAWAQAAGAAPADAAPAAPSSASTGAETERAASQAKEAAPEGSGQTAAPAAPAEQSPTGTQQAGKSELLTPPPPPATRPRLAVGDDTFYAKPILVVAGGVHVEQLIQTLNKNRESRTTTIALTRFGFEGKLGPYVSFRSEFERNIRAHGSGIWEGTASLSVRDQYVRLQRWNATVDAGIVLDPASVDFISTHIADVLLADKYTRDPLLYSGFNRGQGVQAGYEWRGLRAGFNLTAANPLSTSSSFQVGGTFGGGSRLWERPLGNFRIGQPDDDLHFVMLSPSLTYTHELFEAKTMVQSFNVNYQTNARTDPRIKGYNVRGNLLFKLKANLGVPLLITPFVNYARVQNDVTNSTPGFGDQLLSTRFLANTFSAGLDVNVQGRSGVGFELARVSDRSPNFVAPIGETPASEPITRTVQTYLNIGGTWWLTDQVALGARYARYNKEQTNVEHETDASYFATLRLVL